MLMRPLLLLYTKTVMWKNRFKIFSISGDYKWWGLCTQMCLFFCCLFCDIRMNWSTLFQLFVGAMMPPSADRSNICGRFTRHLNVIYLDTFDDETLDKIFGSIMSWHFSNQEDETIQQLSKVCMMTTMMMHDFAINRINKLCNVM